MNTVTISRKEYNALVFAKAMPVKKKFEKNRPDWNASFGIMKNSFGKAGSVSVVNNMRKSWRE